MFYCPAFSTQKTLNAQRPTLNAQYFFRIQCWTLGVGRWTFSNGFAGGVAERLIAPVLKTGRPKGLVSSNLTPSAILIVKHLERQGRDA
jgi:hypothetical protein